MAILLRNDNGFPKMKRRYRHRIADIDSLRPTLRIDPSRRISFRFGMRSVKGFHGDSVATALYGHGVRIFSRSIKFRRPRGLYSLNGESANCLMEIDGRPNEMAETLLLEKGMRVRPQNVRFSLKRDPSGFMDRMDWALPAGFYLSRFHKPSSLRPFFLKRIRRAAGIGRIDPDYRSEAVFDRQYIQTDVCVIGGGPAGMAAAMAAAESGVRVVLLESRPWLGGNFDHRTGEFETGVNLHHRSRSLADQVDTASIRRFHQTVAIDLSEGAAVAFRMGGGENLFDRRLLDIRYRSVVVATGCTERALLFEHNDRPGVMQVDCAYRLARSYGIFPGTAAVFSVGHDEGLEAAAGLHDLGMAVRAVADCRAEPGDSKLVEALSERKIPYLSRWHASEAKGKKRVEGVVLRDEKEGRQAFGCDLLVASAGLSPVIGPLSVTGAEPAYDPETGFYLPRSLPPGVHMAGRITGLTHAGAVEASGRSAGLRAAGDCGASVEAALQESEAVLQTLPGPAGGKTIFLNIDKGKKTFVCFDMDVTVKHLRQSVDRGFDTPEPAKRFTGAGTGPGQGGIPGPNLPWLLARLREASPEGTRPTTARPPLVPAPLAVYGAGRIQLNRFSPVHSLLKEAGAAWDDSAGWRQAAYFDFDPAARKEIEAVRGRIGIMDAAAQGKFRVFGPDAVQVLERIFIGKSADLTPGRAKHSFICNEYGGVLYEAVTACRGPEDYLVFTAPGMGKAVYRWMIDHSENKDWDYRVADLTESLGAVRMAGPLARELLQGLTESNVSNPAFPLMGFRRLRLMKEALTVQALRTGAVGEVTYDLYMPASLMAAAWKALTTAGEAFGMHPYGLKADTLLRLEKGRLHIHRESENRVTLLDLGLERHWRRNRSGAGKVGDAALRHTAGQTGRMKRVGFRMESAADRDRPLQDGAIVVDDTIRGHVCLTRYSDTLGEQIGTALVAEHLAEPGTRLNLFEHDMEPHQRRHALVVPLPFYDPDHIRMKG